MFQHLISPASRRHSEKPAVFTSSRHISLHSTNRSVVFVVSLVFFLIGGCEKSRDALLDSTGTPPVLRGVALSPSIINTDSIGIGTAQSPQDNVQLSTTVTATVEQAGAPSPITVITTVRRDLGSGLLSTTQLSDDGQAPDTQRDDGIYSGKLSFGIKRVEIGTYAVETVAETKNGYRSASQIVQLRVIRSNLPPAISDVQAPDTVTLGNQNQALQLRVKATDPNGLEDIQRVIFNSFRPDGQPSSGNPFQMFDDGEQTGISGDQVKGDGIYSLRISLPASTQTGTYRFEFRAFDRLNEGSNTIVHSITVRP
ncbi:MAG: hypothetical protein WEE20_03480 [Bacteroidota bacterium]